MKFSEWLGNCFVILSVMNLKLNLTKTRLTKKKRKLLPRTGKLEVIAKIIYF